MITVRSCAHQNTKGFGPTSRAVLRDGGPQIRTEPSTSRWGAGGFRRAWRLLGPVAAGRRPLRAGGASEGSASLSDGSGGSRLLEIRGECSTADGHHGELLRLRRRAGRALGDQDWHGLEEGDPRRAVVRRSMRVNAPTHGEPMGSAAGHRLVFRYGSRVGAQEGVRRPFWRGVFGGWEAGCGREPRPRPRGGPRPTGDLAGEHARAGARGQGATGRRGEGGPGHEGPPFFERLCGRR